ncbi:hypothetical protein MKK68_20050 [Methylobacterium sp. E-016]|uniref:hypothetical protein n=1 Tax=Methylobacterium sp. E-016 TaxID=2836556 RepID=UPI001FBA6640|nr:hypothetical protein [Methylobacterium sp. E-016]MCJ2077907.1 hypothetical protein [Methylobacterium sp. E-016]
MASQAKSERRSQITRHPERLSIELARLKGVSLDKIAARFDVHRDAIARHMANLDPDYRAALAADVPISELAERAAAEGGSILDNLSVLRGGLMQAAFVAKAGNDHHAYAALSRVALEVIRETGKFTGEMANAPTIQNITNNVAVLMHSPIMHRLQAMLASRLRPYPEAFDAVMDGLAELEANPQPTGVLDVRAA